MPQSSYSDGAPPLPRLLLAAALFLVVVVFIPGLANPFVVPKESVIALSAAFAVLLLMADRHMSVVAWPTWWTAVVVAPVLLLGAAALINRGDLLASDGILHWCVYALFVVALRLSFTPGDGRRLLRYCVLLGAIEGALVSAQVLAGEVIFDFSALPSAKFRAFGTLGNPNWVGGFLAATLPLALAALDDGPPPRVRWRRGLEACAVVAIVTGLLLTLSRGAWLGAAAAVALLAVVQRDLAWRRIATAGAAGAALALSIGWLRLGTDEMGAAVARRGSLEGRARMWAVSAAMIEKRPLFGWGLGHFAGAYAPFQRRYLQARGDRTVTDLTDHPHSEFVHLAVEGGVVAALAFVALLGLLLWRATVQRNGASAAALLALAVQGAVDTTLRQPATAMLFCVLLVGVLSEPAPRLAVQRRRLRTVERLLLVGLALIAILFATRALVADRALADARRRLASGDAHGARSIVADALPLDPANAELWATLAVANDRAGDLPAARAAAERAHARRPSPQQVYIIANADRAGGARGAAIVELRELSQTVPGLLQPRVLLGEVLADDGQTEAARAVLSEVLTMQSKVPGASERSLHERAERQLLRLPAHGG